MNIIRPMIILLLTLALPANAEVFKCKSPSGEMIYQPSPCTPGEIPAGTLKIKEMTPEEGEKASALRKAEEEEEANYEAERAKAEKQRQSELAQQQELELQQRRTKALEDEANTMRSRAWRPPQPIFR